jgi:hypothetical protein
METKELRMDFPSTLDSRAGWVVGSKMSRVPSKEGCVAGLMNEQ